MDDKDQVAIVFETIGNAAQMLKVIEPGKCADVFEKQMDRAFYTDPTLAQQVLAQSKNVDRKLRLLRAAQAFVAEFEKVANEVIEEMKEKG